MSKLKAINYLEEMDEDLKSFLDSVEVEVVDEKEHKPADPFIFIGKTFQELSDSIMFSDREAETYVITMDLHDGDWSEITDLKITLLHYDMMMSETGKIVVGRLFTNGTSIQLEKSFGEAMTDMKSFKVSNPLYTGHYSDIAFDYAFSKKKSYLQVRNYLNSLMTFLTYLQQGEYLEVPFDVDIGVTNEGLVLQVVAPVKQLQYDILQKGLSKQFKNEPYGNLLLNCIEIAGYFDIFTVKSSKKVIFTAIWIDSVPSRNFSYKVYDSLEHKIYGTDIIASEVVLNYDFNSDTDGIYLPGRFMADKTRGRWFRIVKAQEIKKTLDELKKTEQEFEEHKPFKDYLIEKFDTQFSKDEILFMHRAHLSDELRSMFLESVFKSKMDFSKLETEIQRIMESLLTVDAVWPDKETKEEVYSEAVMSGITSKITLVFKKNTDQEKIKKMIMGIFIKEAKLDMRVANKLAEMFVSNGFDLFAVENFKEAFNHESGNTIMDSDEIAELKERFAEIEDTMGEVNSINDEFAKESQNDELIARNKQLSKEVQELQNKLKKNHGGFMNKTAGNKGTAESQLKAKIKTLEAQVREANKKIEQMAKMMSAKNNNPIAGGKGKEKADSRRDRKIKQLEMLYQKSQKQAEKVSKDLLEKKSLIAKQKNEIQLLKNQLKQAQKKAA